MKTIKITQHFAKLADAVAAVKPDLSYNERLAKEIIGIGVPTHFRPTSKNVSACGVEHPERAAYDGRDTDCILCQRTKAWKRYTGSNADFRDPAK